MPALSAAQRAWAFAVKGPAWAKRHHFDTKGPLPERVAQADWDSVEVTEIAANARAELDRFWAAHPALRKACTGRYGYDPVHEDIAYWRHGLAEPEHATVRARVEARGGLFTLRDVRQWEKEEVAHAALEKAGIPAYAHYRQAVKAGVDCGTCDFYEDGRCEMFEDAPVRADFVCDRWQGRIDKADPLYTATVPHSSHAVSSWSPTDLSLVAQLTESLEPGRLSEGLAKADGALYLISHAKTRYNRPGQPHDIVQGWREIPIDAEGRAQAGKLGAFLKEHGVETLYASSLKRALQTAEIAAAAAGIKVVSDPAFRPWNLGDFAGHSSADVLPKLKPFMDNPDRPVDGGESFNEYERRFLPALEKLLDLAEEGHVVALVTHSRNVETVEGWLGGEGYRSKIDTKAIEADKIEPATVIEVSDRDGKLVVGKSFQIAKGQAHPAEVALRVHGVSRAPGGLHVYRMVSRDGHYIGRTNPSRVRARKGDVLKVQTGDFLSDTQGDLRWQNANVVSHYSDAPHSWKELQALAGGALVKDGAPGDAGDLPAAGDMGDPGPPSGPTLAAVHVNAPLPNISVAYANRRLIAQMAKEGFDPESFEALEAVYKGVEPMKQLIYGTVLEPNSLDSQDDYMLPQHVEKAAHAYLKRAIRGKSSVAKLQHRRQGFKRDRASLVPVESFIAPVDFSYDGRELIKKGSWVMGMHCEDPDLWQDFLDGKYTGFSVGGIGVRRSVTGPLHSDIGVPQPADWRPAPHPDTIGQVLMADEGGDEVAVLAKALSHLFRREPQPAPQVHVHIPDGAIQVHSPDVYVDVPDVHIRRGAVQVAAAKPAAVHFHEGAFTPTPAEVHIHEGAVKVDSHVHVPEPRPRGPVRVVKDGKGGMRIVPEPEAAAKP